MCQVNLFYPVGNHEFFLKNILWPVQINHYQLDARFSELIVQLILLNFFNVHFMNISWTFVHLVKCILIQLAFIHSSSEKWNRNLVLNCFATNIYVGKTSLADTNNNVATETLFQRTLLDKISELLILL